MSGAIKVKGANLTLDNVRIAGFDTGVSAENSQMQMSNMDIRHNRVGLDLRSSRSHIMKSNISAYQIDILARDSPIQLIDTVVENIIVNGVTHFIRSQPVSININPFALLASAKEVLHTKDVGVKRAKLKK